MTFLILTCICVGFLAVVIFLGEILAEVRAIRKSNRLND